ncbi:MAG: CCA tRNA nucleotidyltransferase [Candidatus Thalassarchaeaceae archaeon]|nr:CCA tRNA nucleotidyltransferase [Candidatus Thalassarchaeaceae archaeon]
MEEARRRISLSILREEDRIVLDRLRVSGEAWIVGGWVRDFLSGLSQDRIDDMDIATNLRPEQVKEIFPRSIMIGEKFGTVIVRIDESETNDYEWEVTTLREDGGYSDGRRPENVVFGKEIEDDLERRDFTINAMAIEISEKLVGNDEPEGELLDFWEGLEDLEGGLLRAVGDAGKRLGEDGLRVIRAFRFLECGEDGLRNLDPELSNAISSNLRMLEMVSKERIWNELGKILRGHNSKEIVEKMHAHGVLDKIIPGVSVNLEVRHSRDQMVNLALMCSSETSHGSKLSEELSEYLRLSRKEASTLVLLHGLRDLELDTSIESVRRFMASHPDRSTRRMILDYLSGTGVETGQFEACYQSTEELRAGNSPLIDGNLLSSLTGIEPGRKLGRLKDWLHRIQVEGDIENRESAISMLDEIHWEDSEFEDWPVLSWP